MSQSHVLEFKNNGLLPILFGEHNAHLNYLEEKLGIRIADRGNQLTLSGEPESLAIAERILNTLWQKIERHQDVGKAEIDAELRFIGKQSDIAGNGPVPAHSDLVIPTRRKTIAPRSPNQSEYIKAIKNREMVFGLGPAGTGKTYLAVAVGVSMFLSGEVERLVFCRPAVEAGERLGFLPGDMKEKVDPYLRPIYDAMHDMLPWDFMMKKMETGDIEVAPLAFMRGRTLANAFVILDEAQNTTPTQMKMFLTRMGESSRMVINGDLTQTDLPSGVKSGLMDACETLEGVDDIGFIHFNNEDVVRHHLVRKIIQAYDNKNNK